MHVQRITNTTIYIQVEKTKNLALINRFNLDELNPNNNDILHLDGHSIQDNISNLDE